MLLPIITLAPSLARTANGNGDGIDLLSLSKWQSQNGSPQLLVQCNVTAVSGTSPSLVLLIQDSIDGSNWNTILTFTAITTVSRVVMSNGIRGDAYPVGIRWPFNSSRVRAQWTITGTTPNFTFDVKVNIV